MWTLRISNPWTSPSSALAVVQRKIGLNWHLFGFFQNSFVGSILLEFCTTWSFILKTFLNFCQKIKLYLLLDRVAYVPWSFGDAGVEIKLCVSSSSPHCACPTICTYIFFVFLLSPMGINSMKSPVKRSFSIPI